MRREECTPILQPIVWSSSWTALLIVRFCSDAGYFPVTQEIDRSNIGVNVTRCRDRIANQQHGLQRIRVL